MADNSIYGLQQSLKESNTELIFSGTFSQGLIEELGEALKHRLKTQQVTKSKISTSFFIFIELAQNIKNYMFSKENSIEYQTVAGSCLIAISKTETGYCVKSGNIVYAEDIDELKEKLDKILSMERDELNCFFKEVSQKEIDKETGRAGLGLVQITRKAAGTIEYQFQKVNEIYSYYTLTVNV